MPPSSTAAMQSFSGIPNFRDFGGHPTRDGRRVRHGRLYRSQSFHFATAEDLAQLARMDIRLVCDLRSHSERTRYPTPWHPSADPIRLHLDISADARAGDNEFKRIVQAAPDREGVHRGMIATYRSFPAAFRPVLGDLFAHLQDEKHLPAVIHCHAGKDRTGFSCAMVLSALGVDRAQVLADYMLSQQHLDRAQMSLGLAELFSHLLGVRLSAEALEPANDVHVEYLEAALDQVDADYGSMDAYLEQVGGLTPEKRARLQALMLE